jgi:hypothetical protein
MYELKDNEKITPVMIYTDDALYHGKLITREMVRVNIFLRTEGAPTYLHLHEAQIISPGSTIRAKKLDEVFIPLKAITCFHTAPDVEIELDYDSYEENRRLVPVIAILNSFFINSSIRISTQTELSSTLEVARMEWLSLYDAEITNPYLPQMTVQVAMLIVRPEKVSLGIVDEA